VEAGQRLHLSLGRDDRGHGPIAFVGLSMPERIASSFDPITHRLLHPGTLDLILRCILHRLPATWAPD
jgi:hypothetical protein